MYHFAAKIETQSLNTHQVKSYIFCLSQVKLSIVLQISSFSSAQSICLFNLYKMTIIEMHVHMDCAGCEAKIKKSLLKLKGVDEVETDMAMQKVTVTGWADQKKVLKTVRKTGRRAELWPSAYNPEFQTYMSGRHYFHQPQFSSAPSSTYNYYKHGYDGHNQSHGHYSSYHTIFGRTSSMFSDENTKACSIM